MMIDVKNISFQFDQGNIVFDNINFRLSEGHIGIVGDNGVGKTTLINLISGRLLPQKGTISLEGKVKIVSQFNDWEDYHSPGELQLQRLKDAVFSNPDILLLDEPTSNLDKNGIKVLSGLIRHFSGIVLLISHDFDFLDSTTDNILLIENRRAELYEQKFEDFQLEYEKKRHKEFQMYEVQKKQKNQQRKSVQRLQEKSQRSKKVRGISNSDKKAKGLAGKYDKVQNRLATSAKNMRQALNDNHYDSKPFTKIGLKILNYYQNSGKISMQLSFSNVKVNENYLVNSPFKINIKSGHVLSLLGDNGVGKTSLLDKLFQKLDEKNVHVNYFHQNINQDWCSSIPLITQLMNKSGIREEIILEVAGALGVNREMLTRSPNKLSGGQLLKVQLILCLISAFDVLILDEPTNYLDYDGVVALTTYINDSKAALVIVSHDKRFIENVTTDVVVIENKTVVGYLTLQDYFNS
ncbi:MAG: ATP-binding cassette domain-containing protein [Leuconostoc gelidum]|jgi:macrolide transport system ATP-binding/permease protein|uniref:ABC-F family ATP-binding cassette domain-containing protein n=1 Tax=Leuconostoc gelidum subsp. gelidum TaxID=1607839 RepID=A0AB35FYU4_LEUGE|nr:ATP-binding cassette domain-containing protein [Leuconostoc gelidum]MBZ5964985.1 ABC-F family ATP-binding cassette domain-containing protein [Leuconostoc gelidum subsp. gelidum]MBZ5974450.1 ABC-F family ATP-binding cassette domain-containing protein [Leuconostoc gelidum subsp. gelidum]MBZ5977289.1 ABC-F family ATP-binding cassette domain-containing protein [Leuconostoc gelidum subsp. gelidum]MBZ5979469.1 ABC-F family ATP-binding cassette domain-containing protein [Leuconostoc gelidum subsp. 